MGHAVYHRTASGEAQLDDVSSLEAALELVERLRNEEGPTDVRLFKEVPVEVRTYYRVVAADEDGSSEPTTTSEAVVDRSPADGSSDATTTGSDAATDAFVQADGDAEVAQDETPDETPVVASTASRSEPPAGAMPLLSPPPAVTVHDDDDAEPATAAPGGEHRPKLFNRS